MAWAVRAETKRAVYVVTLPRDEKGLACQCMCPACGGVLQAVNNGRPAEHYLKPNTLRPFFRHHTGQQRAECLVGVAQLAALKLLVESREIDLPAPSSRQSVVGASGAVYTQSSTGLGRRATVVERAWIDDQSASITLDDGRVVLVQLAGRNNYRDDGPADAVITIRVDDPEVSTWPPEKILEQAQLDGRWMCWERHWEDGSLKADALAKAEDEAKKLLDLTPAGLTMPDGLTPLQRSESVLHWVIKDILAAAGELKTPAVRELVTRRMPDGKLAQRTISLPEMTLRLTDVRVEHNLDRLIPDVMCRALSGTGRFKAIDLMIEVAVTHRVDDVKRSRIRERNLACIEFDVDLLSRGGRMTIDRLQSMVLGEPSNKRWVIHPEFELQARNAEAELDLMASEIEAAQLREKARRTWFDQLSTEQAAQEYLALLRAFWRRRSDAEMKGWASTPAQMAELLSERGIKGVDAAELSGSGGILRVIDAIRTDSLSGSQSASAYRNFRAIYESVEERRFVTLILIAIQAFKPEMKAEDAEALSIDRDAIKNSIAHGEETFARPQKWDEAVGMMFPEMAAGLAQAFGTAEYSARIVKQRCEVARQVEHARLEAEAAVRESALRQQNAERLRVEISDAIHEVCGSFEWGPLNDGIPLSEDGAIRMMGNWGRGAQLSDKLIREIVFAAWAAREKGESLSDWIKSQDPKSDSDVHILRRLLEKAWLVFQIRK